MKNLKPLTKLEIKDFNDKRILMNEEIIDMDNNPEITVISELKIPSNYLNDFCQMMLGSDQKEWYEYLYNKLHGNIILSSGAFTTKEDQPDFQYIFELGLQQLQFEIEQTNKS